MVIIPQPTKFQNPNSALRQTGYENRFYGDLAVGRGLGRLGRFRGAGSLCDHTSDRARESLRSLKSSNRSFRRGLPTS